ncbi:phosphotriesterase family protein [Crossiella cryophila]|uniref:Phosphotriesterase-related protein n=1 Tax=Crossiella cryophila TaxID=43355 RepID=A0A7W7CGZ3_9PSEU|nr:phosphotriesterase-related protein [Crossiella cryophila]MBB4681028.1 phosphotriesterase-related protein [Crossiella cryophila]
MPTVHTLGGAKDPDQLGRTLMHEHVFIQDTEIMANYPHLWDESAEIDNAVARLQALRDTGISAIADPTVLGLGRDIPRLLRVAARVPELTIIVATGLYTYRDVPLTLHHRGPGTTLGGEDPLIPLFLRDLTEGIADTGVRAAFLKCAADIHGLTPDVTRVLHAVIAAHHQTGAPITVHTSVTNNTPLEVQDLLKAEGVDLSRVVLGHVGDTTDLDLLKRLADNGSYLGMDRFGLDLAITAEQRIETVRALCAAGYAERMVLSQDSCSHIDWFPPGVKEQILPNWRYDYLSGTVIPTLLSQGVPQSDIDQMLITNPRDYFTPA